MTRADNSQRVSVRIDDAIFQLAPDEDPHALQSRIETAAAGSAKFVTFAAAGGHTVSVLITAGSRVVIAEVEPSGTIASDTPFGVHLVED